MSSDLFANDRISLFFMAEHYFIVCLCHVFFIHLSVDGHIGCLYCVLAVVNNAAVSLGVQMSFLDSDIVFLG